MAAAPVALDSNVLLPLLYLWDWPTRLGRDRRVKDVQRREAELVRDIVAGHPLVFTTHVLTEVSNLIDLDRHPLGADFHLILRKIVRDNTVADDDFETVSRRPEYSRLGLADAGLIVLSLKGTILLTRDRKLYERAKEIGGNAIHALPA